MEAEHIMKFAENDKRRLIMAEPRIIPMNELKGGEVGEILESKFNRELIGRYVIRDSFGGRFAIIGIYSDDTSSDGYNPLCTLKVRVLEDGETITIKYN